MRLSKFIKNIGGINIIGWVISLPGALGYFNIKFVDVKGWIGNMVNAKVNLIPAIFIASLIIFTYRIFQKLISQIKSQKIEQKDIDLDIMGRGELLLFSLSQDNPNLRAWLKIVNKSEKLINLETVEFRISDRQQLTIEDVQVKNIDIRPKASKVISCKKLLNDSELKIIKNKKEEYFDVNMQIIAKFRDFSGKYTIERIENIDIVKAQIVGLKKEIEMELSKEHYYVLSILLNQSNRSYARRELEQAYKQKFNKTTADFNILESDLQKLDLIFIGSGYYGRYWKLNNKGLDVASKAHKLTSEN